MDIANKWGGPGTTWRVKEEERECQSVYYHRGEYAWKEESWT